MVMCRHLHLALLALLQQLVAADIDPFINSAEFDAGEYGRYPTTSYHSSTALSPRLNILTSNKVCQDGAYTFITPRGKEVDAKEAGGPIILDDTGNLVWAAPRFGKTGDPNKKEETFGLNVQTYKGKDYLTFWVGDDTVQSHGEGIHYMLDEHYEVAYQFDGSGGLQPDLHEFQITDEGTALMTTYKKTQVKPTMRKFQGWIWDSVVQEVNIETKELIFEWHASDYYDVKESPGSQRAIGSYSSPFDFFHINSIDKDPAGNYLVSSRYMHTLTYINGSDGSIIWVLGGRRNDFQDLSDGKATSFILQHHARWNHNYSSISLFDNSADSSHSSGRVSRGLLLSVDTNALTVSLIGEYFNPANITSISQGSVQVLPNGNVFVGYGYNGAFTEYAPNGTVLCDTHFGISSRFSSGDVQSYRAFRHNWVGKPKTNPDLAVVNDIAFVSWNGATEVVHWMIQGSVKDSNNTEFYAVKSVEKMGFETGISLDGLEGDIRVVALDINGDVLGATDVVTLNLENTNSHDDETVTTADIMPLWIWVGLMMGVIIALATRDAYSYWMRRKALKYAKIADEGDEELQLQGVKGSMRTENRDEGEGEGDKESLESLLPDAEDDAKRHYESSF